MEEQQTNTQSTSWLNLYDVCGLFLGLFVVEVLFDMFLSNIYPLRVLVATFFCYLIAGFFARRG
jgi:hypothetical protein